MSPRTNCPRTNCPRTNCHQDKLSPNSKPQCSTMKGKTSTRRSKRVRNATVGFSEILTKFRSHAKKTFSCLSAIPNPPQKTKKTAAEATARRRKSKDKNRFSNSRLVSRKSAQLCKETSHEHRTGAIRFVVVSQIKPGTTFTTFRQFLT